MRPPSLQYLAILSTLLLLLFKLNKATATSTQSTQTTTATPSPSLIPSHYQWRYETISSIGTAQFPSSSQILIQTLGNDILFYHYNGTLISSTSAASSLGTLIKSTPDYAILYASGSKHLTYITLLSSSTPQPQSSIDLSPFIKSDTPHFKSSLSHLLIYDSATLITLSHGLTSSPPIASPIPENYIILSASIDPIHNTPYILLKYKKSQICLASLTLLPSPQPSLHLDRCRQITYNDKPQVFASPNGFLVTFTSSPLIRIFFFNQLTEEVFKPRAKILKIHTFENSDAVVLQYTDSHIPSELCYLTLSDFHCFGIEFKLPPLLFFPQPSGLLFLHNASQSASKPQILLSFIDRDSYSTTTFAALPIHAQQVFAAINTNHSSINVLVQSTDDQTSFITTYSKTYQIHLSQDSSLSNTLPPLLFRIPNQSSNMNPYSNTEQPIITLATPSDQWSIERILLNFIDRSQKDFKEIIEPILNNPKLIVKKLLQSFDILTDLTIDRSTFSADSKSDALDYQLDKLMVVVSKSLKVFGISSSTGDILYKSTIPLPADQEFNVDDNSNNSLFAKASNFEVVSLISLQKEQQFIAVLLHKPTNQTTLQYLCARSGKHLQTISNSVAYFKNAPKKALLGQFIQDSPAHVVLVHESQLEILPTMTYQETKLANDSLDKSKVFFLRRNGNAVGVLRLGSIETIDDLTDVTVAKFKHESMFQLPDSQKLLLFAKNSVVEQIQTTAFMKESQQALIPIDSVGKDTYRWIDFERRAFIVLSVSDSSLFIAIVDTASNKVIMEKRIASIATNQPIDLLFKNNIAFVSFFSKYYNRQQLLMIRIVFKHFLTVFDLLKDPLTLQLPISSIVCTTRLLFSEVDVVELHDIVEVDGEYLLLSSKEHDLLLVDINALNDSENTLKSDHFKRINEKPVRGETPYVHVTSTLFASRKTIIVTGQQVFSTAISPDGSFDRLPSDFDFDSVRVSVWVVCCVGVVLLILLLLSCGLKEKKKLWF